MAFHSAWQGADQHVYRKEGVGGGPELTAFPSDTVGVGPGKGFVRGHLPVPLALAVSARPASCETVREQAVITPAVSRWSISRLARLAATMGSARAAGK